jgi:NADPH:quinone reductase-like Zn-dependent oxidoreductase
VIATASSPEKAEQVRGYGAAEVINYKLTAEAVLLK